MVGSARSKAGLPHLALAGHPVISDRICQGTIAIGMNLRRSSNNCKDRAWITSHTPLSLFKTDHHKVLSTNRTVTSTSRQCMISMQAVDRKGRWQPSKLKTIERTRRLLKQMAMGTRMDTAILDRQGISCVCSLSTPDSVTQEASPQ